MDLGGTHKWERKYERNYDTHTLLVGRKALEGRNIGSMNAAQWALFENRARQDGVPSYLRTAVLLKRGSDERFFGTIQITTDVGGFSFEGTIQNVLGRTEKVDPVIFDPRVPPMRPLDGFIDPSDLASCNLKELAAVHSAEILTTAEDVQHLVSSQLQTRTAVETKLDKINQEFERDLGVPLAHGDEQDTFFVELWNGLPDLVSIADQIQDGGNISKDSNATILEILPEVFGNIRCKRWQAPPNKDILYRYFPWCNEEPVSLRSDFPLYCR